MHRVHGVQYESNAPIEDRLSCYQFESFKGYFAAVYDGHGGWQVADACARKMQGYLEKNLKGQTKEKQITAGIKKAFD